MKLAAQLYTVRMFTNTDDEVCKMFERIRKAGYEAVQLSGIKAYNPQNIARALKENGLSVCSTHNSLDRIVKETDALIEEHRLFGTSYIGLGTAWKSIRTFCAICSPPWKRSRRRGCALHITITRTSLSSLTACAPSIT